MQDVKSKLDQQILMSRSLSEWQPILAKECQVYQFENGSYLAKRFSQIQYMICDAETATTIIIDNLHALLRNKYFNQLTDEVLERINQIIRAFTTNLSTVLQVVAYKKRSRTSPRKDVVYVKNLPIGCVAFRNGVFDFAHNTWLFKYEVSHLNTGADLVEYPLEYIVRFYFNFDFESIDLNVNDYTLDEFVTALKELDRIDRNLCFELVYNMSFDETNTFDIARFEHLCEIMGYMCCSAIIEQFCIIFGTGQNGKDSLFRGCFTTHIIPTPSSLSLDSILENVFATGTLERACHNLNLELSPKTYKDVARLKALTGGEEIDIERKNVQSHTGVINCKYLFAGNVQDDIKFTDTSNGFLRRVNIFNVHYVWDDKKRFLQRGEYYDTTFTLDDLKYDENCAIIFIYLAMFGLKAATNNFTTDFKFTHNEWTSQYANIDEDLVHRIHQITPMSLLEHANKNAQTRYEFDKALYSKDHMKLWRKEFDPNDFVIQDQETYMKVVNPNTNTVTFKSSMDFLNSDYTFKTHNPEDPDEEVELNLAEQVLQNEPEFFIKSSFLQALVGLARTSARDFNVNMRRTFGQTSCERVVDNQPYYRCTFENGRHLTIIK